MTGKIDIIEKIKEDVVIVVNRKNKFEHLPEINLVKTTATASLSHLNSSNFYC